MCRSVGASGQRGPDIYLSVHQRIPCSKVSDPPDAGDLPCLDGGPVQSTVLKGGTLEPACPVLQVS